LAELTSVSPGEWNRHHAVAWRVDLTAGEQARARRGGGPSIADAFVPIVVPPGFDPEKGAPVRYTSVTGDRFLSNHANALEFYAETCREAGYLLVSADGPEWPERDTFQARAALFEAAIRSIREAWPGAREWRLYLAGYSGGAKLTTRLAAFA